jgi:hypothetical protein
MAWLAVHEAWASAVLDDRAQVLRSFGRAEDEFTNADQEEVHAWTEFCDETELTAIKGIALTQLPSATNKDLEAGRTHLVEVDRTRSEAKERSRVLMLPMLARAHLRTDSRDDALRITDGAVSRAETMASIRPIDWLVDLLPEVRAVGTSDAQDIAHRITGLADGRTSRSPDLLAS